VRHTQLLNDRGAGWKTIENLTKDNRGGDNDESAYSLRDGREEPEECFTESTSTERIGRFQVVSCES
jgi:hypothetical protein